MALDKETALSIAHRKATKYRHADDEQFIFNATHINDFAQAIYELGYGDGASNDINSETNYNRGASEERERIAKQFDEAGWRLYAEVVRNSNNAHKDCDSNSHTCIDHTSLNR